MADDELFDLERLRRNWTPAAPEHEAAPIHPVLAGAIAQPDPAESALELLAQLRGMARLRFPEHRTAVDAFLDELVQQAETFSSEPSAETIAQFEHTLGALEDLLEAFLIIEGR